MKVTYTHVEHINKARHIMRTLGIKCASAYLRNRGWSLDATLWILLNK